MFNLGILRVPKKHRTEHTVVVEFWLYGRIKFWRANPEDDWRTVFVLNVE